jgi:hypothetical protein
LFDLLYTPKLSGNWENYVVFGESPINDFYDILGIDIYSDDLNINEDIENAIRKSKKIIDKYEKGISFLFCTNK